MTMYPGAIFQPGPANKTNGGVNKCRGVVCHSMVGMYPAALGELLKPSRRASWAYSVLKDGRVFGHYPDEAQTWHAGSARNNDLIGIEHEGGFSPHNEPLTPKQLEASVNLVRWLSQRHRFPMERGAGRGDGMFEHNQVSDSPTACPSSRIPWQFYTDEEPEDEDMVPYLAWNIDAKAVYLIGPFGAVWVTSQEDVKTLEGLYGKMAVALHDSTIKALAA